MQEGRVFELEGQVKAQAEEIKRLKQTEVGVINDISAMELKLDGLEQQTRSNNIRILGLKETQGEIPVNELYERLKKEVGLSAIKNLDKVQTPSILIGNKLKEKLATKSLIGNE